MIPKPRQVLAGPGSPLLTENFAGSTVADPGFVPLNNACLTGASTTPPGGMSRLGPCSGAGESAGPVPPAGVTPGYLQLTDSSNDGLGSVLYNRPLPGNGGLQVSFTQYQYGGNTGADGIGFYLVDGSANLTSAGGFGGSLGYAQHNGAPGVVDGYLGVGLDAYGNYTNDSEQRGTGCQPPDVSPVVVQPLLTPNAVGLRGPGNGQNGYCYLAASITPDASAPSKFRSTLPGSLRSAGTSPAAAARTVRVTVTPDEFPTVTVEIDFRDGAGFQTVFAHQMTTAAPPTYKFGLSASTGFYNDVHLIGDMSASSLVPLDELNLVKTVVNQQSSYQVGDTVHYQFLVTNTGTDPLNTVSVDDPSVSNISCPSTTLGTAGSATASMVCTGSHVVTAADALAGPTYTNTAQATATSAVSAEPLTSNQSSAQVDVTSAQLQLSKSASPTTVHRGDKVGYTLTVTNNSTFALNPATASDDLSGVLSGATYDNDVQASSGSATVTGSTLA
ncbi:hypothetical protein ACFQ9X_32530 [Catenulispora yoronensis]